MYLFVGLGNPGTKHENNRHNVGFMAIDAIAKRFDFPDFTEKYDGQLSKAEIAGEKVILLKPQTFMNLSGSSVSRLANFYKIAINNVFVIYDELDLELGKVKIKQAGGDGGHNGIKSIDSLFGKNYWRVRYGIDHPGMKDMVSSYVLSNFINKELLQVEKDLKTIAENLEMLINGERELFLTKYFELPQKKKEIPKTKTKDITKETEKK